MLRRELDLWSTAWQQVEAFLDRVDGARDADDPHREKAEALLRVAGVVERRRALTVAGVVLAEPAVDAMPGGGGGWDAPVRTLRLPGADELELAVANLLTFGGTPDDEGEFSDLLVLNAVGLSPERDIFTRAARPGDPPALLRLPGYPPIAAGGRQVALAADDAPDDVVSQFSYRRRYDAATAALPGFAEPSDTPLVPWSGLARSRRLTALPAQISGSVIGAAGTGIGAAAAVLARLRANTVTAAEAADLLQDVVAAASGAASAAATDAQALRDAADVLDAAGTSVADLPGIVREAASGLGSVQRWTALANAAAALRAVPSSATARNALDAAIQALQEGGIPALLAVPVEDGPLRADLDEATGARIAYPDGSLRILRTIEAAFAASWPHRVRWLHDRHARHLAPLAARAGAPFVAGVRALVNGGDTGLVYQGLTVGEDATAGVEQLTTDAPASLARSLDELEPGTVGIVGGPRSAAVVLLGPDRVGDRLALHTAPLRVSTAPGEPGVPGLLPAGSPIGSVASGLSDAELRLGEAAAGPAADGPVHEAVALWSRLCLVHGRAGVDAEVAGPGALRTVPEPAAAPLQSVPLHGSVPANATSIVLGRLPAAFWAGPATDRLSLVARPGELLLLRGTAEGEDGAPGPVVQAVVEVDRVVRTTGSMLARIDTATAGVLSADPAALPAADAGEPCLVCGPEEDVALVVLRRSWAATALVSGVTLRRDFAGFDLPSLATGTLLPLDLLDQVIDGAVPAGPLGVDRAAEFAAALDAFGAWTRHAMTEAT